MCCRLINVFVLEFVWRQIKFGYYAEFFLFWLALIIALRKLTNADRYADMSA